MTRRDSVGAGLLTRPVVIKFGGSVLDTPVLRRRFIKDLARAARRSPLVLVHGGGPEITRALAARGIRTRFLRGLRVTPSAAMKVVEAALGLLNRRIAAALTRAGRKSVGLSGRACFAARPLRGYGRVGRDPRATPTSVRTTLAAGGLPVVSSLADDGRGGVLNVNADHAASALAVTLKAARLVMLTDVAGVLDGAGRVLRRIRLAEAPALIRRGVIGGGMIPKVTGAVGAVRRGVGEVVIADGRRSRVVSDLLAGRPVGTRVVK